MPLNRSQWLKSLKNAVQIYTKSSSFQPQTDRENWPVPSNATAALAELPSKQDYADKVRKWLEFNDDPPAEKNKLSSRHSTSTDKPYVRIVPRTEANQLLPITNALGKNVDSPRFLSGTCFPATNKFSSAKEKVTIRVGSHGVPLDSKPKDNYYPGKKVFSLRQNINSGFPTSDGVASANKVRDETNPHDIPLSSRNHSPHTSGKFTTTQRSLKINLPSTHTPLSARKRPRRENCSPQSPTSSPGKYVLSPRLLAETCFPATYKFSSPKKTVTNEFGSLGVPHNSRPKDDFPGKNVVSPRRMKQRCLQISNRMASASNKVRDETNSLALSPGSINHSPITSGKSTPTKRPLRRDLSPTHMPPSNRKRLRRENSPPQSPTSSPGKYVVSPRLLAGTCFPATDKLSSAKDTVTNKVGSLGVPLNSRPKDDFPGKNVVSPRRMKQRCLQISNRMASASNKVRDETNSLALSPGSINHSPITSGKSTPTKRPLRRDLSPTHMPPSNRKRLRRENSPPQSLTSSPGKYVVSPRLLAGTCFPATDKLSSAKDTVTNKVGSLGVPLNSRPKDDFPGKNVVSPRRMKQRCLQISNRMASASNKVRDETNSLALSPGSINHSPITSGKSTPTKRPLRRDLSPTHMPPSNRKRLRRENSPPQSLTSSPGKYVVSPRLLAGTCFPATDKLSSAKDTVTNKVGSLGVPLNSRPKDDFPGKNVVSPRHMKERCLEISNRMASASNKVRHETNSLDLSPGSVNHSPITSGKSTPTKRSLRSNLSPTHRPLSARKRMRRENSPPQSPTSFPGKYVVSPRLLAGTCFPATDKDTVPNKVGSLGVPLNSRPKDDFSGKNVVSPRHLKEGCFQISDRVPTANALGQSTPTKRPPMRLQSASTDSTTNREILRTEASPHAEANILTETVSIGGSPECLEINDESFEVGQAEDTAVLDLLAMPTDSIGDGAVLLYAEPVTPHPSSLSVEPPSRSRKRTSNGSPKRKRVRNESLWSSNVRKVNKNLGLEYVSAKGKVKRAVVMREACSCSWDCRHRIPEDERQAIFKIFWALGNHERQWDFIRRNSNRKETSPKNNASPRKRKWALTYCFKINGNNERVCKKMFMATLGICDSWTSSAWDHLNVSKGNTISPDKRGRHSNHPKAITPEKVATVKEHINMFPRIPSHYCRKSSKREYLEHGLNESKMARMYIEWAEKESLPKNSVATLRQYKDILNTNFNISFFKPKKDQCALCALIKNKHNPRHIREKYKAAWVTHLRRKDLVKKLKVKDRDEASSNQETMAVVSFDLQKQLQCPKTEVSSFFYRNKLSVFNFTTFHEVVRMGRCYLWHEGLARKGSSEIASSLLLVIKDLKDKGINDIRFYSDNCGGQNKNRMVFAMYAHAAALHSIKITHRFLEPGHTHMDADTIHARIENATDGTDIWDFEGWVKAIENAKENLPKYDVTKLNRSNIFTFKPLVEKQNWKYAEDGSEVKWSKLREVHVDGNEAHIIKIRYELVGQPLIVNTKQGRVGHPVNLKSYKPPRAYSSLIPLRANTIKDLQYLCESHAIPHDKQPFFRAVLDGVEDDAVDPPSEPEYDSDEELCEGFSLQNIINEDTEETVDADEL